MQPEEVITVDIVHMLWMPRCGGLFSVLDSGNIVYKIRHVSLRV